MIDHSKAEKYSKILLQQLDQVEKIGEGTFGNVYKASYKDEFGKERIIAIKKFKYFEKEQ